MQLPPKKEFYNTDIQKAGPSAGTNRLFLYQHPTRLFLDSGAALLAAVLIGRAFALGRIASIVLAASLFLAGFALRAQLGISLAAGLLAFFLAATSACIFCAPFLALGTFRASARYFFANGIASNSIAAIFCRRSHLLGCIPVRNRRIVVSRLASHKTHGRQSQHKNQFSHCVMVFNLVSNFCIPKTMLCTRTPLQIIATRPKAIAM
ncbi:MAG: hypothetical protein IAB08_09710 [Bacteroidetes bacterium]|uniref:Uncharacterized protein n=1 Tax=Candidatus Pullibacteroides excrementavium TaxID=2840905 RepID=A0A9D9DSW3_9BACT|nr:hypothetical protein [Candidatus Pullibacteroides excrementavium]